MTIDHERFELQNKDGDPIRGDVRMTEAPKADAAIVICHGFKGFKDWGSFPYIAEQLAGRTGFPVIQFNFSGNGVGADLLNFTELDKFEANTFSKELSDLRTVLDTFETGQLPGVDARRRFGILGHSRGGISTIITGAEDERVKAIVTWNAVSYLDRWSEEKKADWRREGRIGILNARTGQTMPLGIGLLEDYEKNADRLNLQAAASRLQIPYLIVHGSADESVPASEAELLAAAAPQESSQHVVIDGGGHTFGGAHPFKGTTEHLEQVIDLTADWFARHL
jgi:pimeloyl-ACP methyl ester carboxylesterase